MSKYRLLVACPEPMDSCSFWRTWGPFGRLRNFLPDIELIEPPERIVESHGRLQITHPLHWQIFAQVDALFLQRPCLEQHAHLVELARTNRKPVWLDYDDDVFNVPPTNPHHKVYERAGPQIERAIRAADVVTVSTEALLTSMQERFGAGRAAPLEFLHIPNAWDERTFPYEPFDPRSVAVWRGSGTHDDDMAACGQQIAELTYECTGVKFVFMGQPNMAVVKRCKPESVQIIDPLDPVRYMHRLKELRPKVVMVPLRDNALNRSKSNIAWLEAAYAGAVCIAPDWPEWHRPGVVNYAGQEHFKARVKEGLSTDTRPVVAAAREYILAHTSLAATNKTRADIARQLCTHSAGI